MMMIAGVSSFCFVHMLKVLDDGKAELKKKSLSC